MMLSYTFPEAVVHRCSVKKMFLKIFENLQKNPCDFIKQETLAQGFSFEFCEIFKSTFFIEHLWWLLLHFTDKRFP